MRTRRLWRPRPPSRSATRSPPARPRPTGCAPTTYQGRIPRRPGPPPLSRRRSDNRLVADALEADWNTALREARQATEDYQRAADAQAPIDQATRQRLITLAADVHALWRDETTPMRERKRVARLLITDVTLTKTEHITAQIRLTGGQQHTLTLPLPLGGGKLRQTPKPVVALIDELLDAHTDAEIADILNGRSLTSGMGIAFHRLMVRDIRQDYGLRPRFDRLRERGLLTAPELADLLGVSVPTVWDWHRAGLIDGEKYNDKNACLYLHPGDDAPRVQQGVKLSDRAAAQRRPSPKERGAV